MIDSIFPVCFAEIFLHNVQMQKFRWNVIIYCPAIAPDAILISYLHQKDISIPQVMPFTATNTVRLKFRWHILMGRSIIEGKRVPDNVRPMAYQRTGTPIINGKEKIVMLSPSYWFLPVWSHIRQNKSTPSCNFRVPFPCLYDPCVTVLRALTPPSTVAWIRFPLFEHVIHVFGGYSGQWEEMGSGTISRKSDDLSGNRRRGEVGFRQKLACYKSTSSPMSNMLAITVQ